MLHQGDNLEVLRTVPSGSVDLVYLDPPFFSQRKQHLTSKGAAQRYEFDDTWPNLADYLSFLEVRLHEMHRVLKDTGSIFFHCDRSASHHIRVLLDKVFGSDNFQSEIIWSYRRWSNAKKGLLNNHQNIYFYSKSADFKFIPAYEAYSPTTNIDQIFQKRGRNANGKAAYVQSADGAPELMSEKKGVPLSDVWTIPFLNPKAKERTGYPTQKPILLLEQVIELVTEPGDVVLDPFCGSGTTLVAAHLLDREYVGIDSASEAIALTRSRLEMPVKTRSALLEKGVDAYRSKGDAERAAMAVLGIRPVERNKGIDGFASVGDAMRPLPVLFHRKPETLHLTVDRLVKACGRNKFRCGIVISEDAKAITYETSGEMRVAVTSAENYSEAVTVLDEELRIAKPSPVASTSKLDGDTLTLY